MSRLRKEVRVDEKRRAVMMAQESVDKVNEWAKAKGVKQYQMLEELVNLCTTNEKISTLIAEMIARTKARNESAKERLHKLTPEQLDKLLKMVE